MRVKKLKNGKVASKDKVTGVMIKSFSSASLFPAKKRKTFTQGRTRGTDHPTRRRTQ